MKIKVMLFKYINYYRFILFFLMIVISNLSCSTHSKKEELIITYLNKNEDSFDRKSFELVELTLLDTIMEHEVYKIDNIITAQTTDGYIESVDTIGSIPPYIMDWQEEDYPIKLYSTLTNNYEYPANYNYKIIMELFRDTKINSQEDFEKALMNNNIFVDSLVSKMSFYVEPFTGCFDSDSLEKYVKISKNKREKLYGYLYLMKFRTRDKLNIRSFLFDSEARIFGYRVVK